MVVDLGDFVPGSKLRRTRRHLGRGFEISEILQMEVDVLLGGYVAMSANEVRPLKRSQLLNVASVVPRLFRGSEPVEDKLRLSVSTSWLACSALRSGS